MNTELNEFQIMLFSKNIYIAVILSVLFLPLTLIFYIIVSIRHFMYDSGLLRSFKPDIFTVSVGNITVGGTGKTPTVISLVNSLKDKKIKPLVVTGGYGRKSTGRIIIKDNTTVSESGDEPLTIYNKTKASVICDRDRVSAIKDMSDNYDIVVLDDAFQHRKVKKNLDLVLIDESRFLGNRLLLPSGILRDTVSRLKYCDVIILSKVKDLNSASVKEKLAYLKKFEKKILISKLYSGYVSDGRSKTDISAVSGMNISLFCGIGYPEDFFDIFAELKIVSNKAYPDHCVYSEKEFSEFAVMKQNSEMIITTYKDFVKIPNNVTAEFNIRYLDIDLKFFDEFNNAFNISDIIKGIDIGKK